MKLYDLVIFDWDGTLMDSIGKIVACMTNVARDLSITVPGEMAIRDIIGLSMHEALNVLFPDADDALYRRMSGLYRQHYLELNSMPSPLFEGSQTLIESLSLKGYRLAVATGKARVGLDRLLGETGLGPHFDASRCADEARSKPHPQMILELLTELDVAPARALMVGDSIHDLNMAKNAGVDAIGVSYGAHDALRLSQAKPKAIIDAPIELLRHV